MKIKSLLLMSVLLASNYSIAQDDLKTTILDLSTQSGELGMCMAHQDYLHASQTKFHDSIEFNRENIGVMETCNVGSKNTKLETTKLLLEGVVSNVNKAMFDQFIKNSEKIGYCERIKSIEDKFKTSDNIGKMQYFTEALEKHVFSYLNISAQSQIKDRCNQIFLDQKKLFASIREM